MPQPRNARWIDISVPLSTGMVHWPGDPPVRMRRFHEMRRGDPCTASQLSMSAHAGTHMDAPSHFLPHGRGMDRMPLDMAMGLARVIAIRHPATVTVEELRTHRIRRGERVLLKTRNSTRPWARRPFNARFVHLSTEAARWLAQRRIRVVGIDYLSVGGYRAGNGAAVHRALLGAGVWIIEGLNLSRVPAGRYELRCLPLKIARGDGAPARAIIQPSSR